jgi:hypothetical protein
MKKLLSWVIAMAMTGLLFAQTATIEEVGDKPHIVVEKIFGNLDKTQITTKRLLNRAIDLISTEDFNGRYLSDSTDVSLEHFGTLYATMCMAITDNQQLPDPRDIYSYEVDNTAPVPIAMLLQRYNYIKTTAIDDNLISANADLELFDVPNRSQSPYGEDTLFVASTVTQYLSHTPQFILPANNFISNVGRVASVKIDFGNGAIPITFGQAFSADLQSGMNQKAILSITLMNGRVLRSRFIYHVADADGSYRGGPDAKYDLGNSRVLTINKTKGFDASRSRRLFLRQTTTKNRVRLVKSVT